MRYLRYLPGWRERGLDTWVATGTPLIEERTESDLDRDWYASRPGELLPPDEIDGTEIRRVRLPDHKGLRRSVIFHRTVVRLCREPELRPNAVQLISNLRARAIPWLLELRRMGIPTLYSVSQFPTWPAKPIKSIYRHHVYRTLYNRLDCLVTNSDPLHDFLRGIGVSTRIEMIPNGVNLDRFQPERDPAAREARRESLGIGPSDPVIVTVGAVMPRKGQDLLLESWLELAKSFPNAHLVLVGPRADLHDPKLESFRKKIESLVVASGAPDRVHFVGMADKVEDYLRLADVFVLASSREGFPNSVLEAMATGLPVVVTPFLGLSPTMGTPDEHYLLADPNPTALSAPIARLLSSPELRERIGNKGLTLTRESFGVETSLDRYVALYRELAAERAG